MKFDLVVLGGGTAGYVGALEASKHGMSVAIVEGISIGGTCLNRGCIPTKSLLHSSAMFAQSCEWETLGILASEVRFDQQKAYTHKDEIVQTLQKGILSQLKAKKIQIYKGFGRIVDEHTIEILTTIDDSQTHAEQKLAVSKSGQTQVEQKLAVSKSGQTQVERIFTENILIATGAVPYKPNIKGSEFALTSDDVLAHPIAGNKIVIVGGGVIGMEFASYFSAIGKEIVVVEAMDKILPMFSKEITLQLSAQLKKNGIRILTSSTVTEIGEGFVDVKRQSMNEGAKRDDANTMCQGANEHIECDSVLIAIGRRACLADIGIESVGLDGSAKCISVDSNMWTGKGKIYAVGDVLAKVQLAHFALACAVTAIESMMSLTHTIDMSIVPSCVYTNPEIAVVGNVSGFVENNKDIQTNANIAPIIDKSDSNTISDSLLTNKSNNQSQTNGRNDQSQTNGRNDQCLTSERNDQCLTNGRNDQCLTNGRNDQCLTNKTENLVLAKTTKYLLGGNGRALINGSNRGFIKIYCNDKDVIVGAELFGASATEIVGELALAINCRLTKSQVGATIHAHPTVYEAIGEACRQ